jgi:hypothetical protein
MRKMGKCKKSSSENYKTMEINQFITQVIVQINKGISNASSDIEKDVLPKSYNNMSKDINNGIQSVNYKDYDTQLISNIMFELSLTNGKKGSVNGGIGVLLGNINIGASGKNEAEQTSISKIKFTIPIVLREYNHTED